MIQLDPVFNIYKVIGLVTTLSGTLGISLVPQLSLKIKSHWWKKKIK